MKKLINKSCNAKKFAAFIVYLFVCAVLAKLMLKGFGDSPGDQFRVLTVHVGNHDEVLAAAVLGEDVAETKGILGDGF